VRERDRPARRHDRLHAASQRAGRDRGRPVGDEACGRPLPARHGHRIRRRATARYTSTT
jgi:hypothetical protein